MSAPRVISTLIVTANGADGDAIERLAEEHAGFDPERRVIRANLAGAIAPAIEDNCAAAVVIVDRKGEICGTLDRRKASVEAWLEDAFLRASH